MRLIGTFLIQVFIVVSAFGQNHNYWQDLEQVTFELRLDDESGYEMEFPKFKTQVQRLDGSTIQLKGYMIPLEGFGSSRHFMFSALPFSSCFFCGGAGPETVVEVESDKSIPYTGKPITIEGILKLNDVDPDRHMYLLSKARVIQ